METIKSSGNLVSCGDGLRDINPENGRCDLLPLKEIAVLYQGAQPISSILNELGEYVYDGKVGHLDRVLILFCQSEEDTPEKNFKNATDILLDLSIHYKAALDKYPPRNWEKGLKSHSYLDSGVRHLLKWQRGDKDEMHNRAFIWNIFGLVWNHNHRLDLIDLPFNDNNVIQDLVIEAV